MNILIIVKVIKKDLNPVWLESFSIPIPNKEDTLTLEVWNKNLIMKNELIGTVNIILHTLINSVEKTKTVPLTGRFEGFLILFETICRSKNSKRNHHNIRGLTIKEYSKSIS